MDISEFADRNSTHSDTHNKQVPIMTLTNENFASQMTSQTRSHRLNCYQHKKPSMLAAADRQASRTAKSNESVTSLRQGTVSSRKSVLLSCLIQPLTHKYTCTRTYTPRHLPSYKPSSTQHDRLHEENSRTHTQTHAHTHTRTHARTRTHTDRQTDRKGQTDRQTDRHTHTRTH